MSDVKPLMESEKAQLLQMLIAPDSYSRAHCMFVRARLGEHFQFEAALKEAAKNLFNEVRRRDIGHEGSELLEVMVEMRVLLGIKE